MRQLPLRITPKLVYSPTNFLVHHGLKEICDPVLSIFKQETFGICYVHGGSRAGKTHLSVYLAHHASLNGQMPRLLEGEVFGRWLKEEFSAASLTPEDVVIIDDADVYLGALFPGQSGEFVNFIESLRLARASLLLLSSTTIEALPCDDHVKSRLVPGGGFQIGVPLMEELRVLLPLLGKQRGIKFTERNVLFLQNRLPRDILSIEEYVERVATLSEVLNSPIKFPILTGAMAEK